MIVQFISLIVLCLSLLGGAVYLGRLRQAAIAAPRLSRLPSDTRPSFQEQDLPLVSVIIPAYNEVDNIAACVTSVLESVGQEGASLEVWVVDDQSTDATWAVLQSLQLRLNDPRLHTLAGEPRPTEQVWMGKNWACMQGAGQAKGDYLLFLDADVRLQPGAIASVVDLMQRQPIDLLTLCPTIVCGCWAEWLIQPLIVGLLAVGYDFAEVNDPAAAAAFANGQLMLFRRSGYETLGGHQAVAAEVVEDVELARRVKQSGLRLQYMLGHDLASVRMYPSFAAIWEGWTKNWYLGSQRNLGMTLYVAAVMVLICLPPWLVMVALVIKLGWFSPGWFDLGLAGVALTAIVLQYGLRQQIERVSGISPRYWWLTGIGGGLVAAIAIASIIKTETGWGWTWRGRELKKR